MSTAIRRMLTSVRRELFAWIFFGLTLRWVWGHGLDKWSTIFALLAIGVHPELNKSAIFGQLAAGPDKTSPDADPAEIATKPKE